ncbi:uncharacterized protein LOC127094649 [Lathyrus oleraceus]|uniref:uncharacterized protein LOC127094649 n=1 Tax=Pisum sativum TaxID=3888 RepID=UPI0021CE5727|nr:uncharacterized protein LOC127094649 [Pisum sativum]
MTNYIPITAFNSRGRVIVKRDVQGLVDEGPIHIHQARNQDDDVNVIVPVFKTPQQAVIHYDSSKRSNRSVSSLVIWLAGPVPYESDKDMPHKYDATMIKDGQEVPLPAATSVMSIIDIVKVTRSGRELGMVFSKAVENAVIGKKDEAVVPLVDPVNTPICQSGESSSLKFKDDNDEVLRLIKKSEFNIVEQLLQTPSKIFVLSLLMNSEACREALKKVLEQAYVEHDVMVHQFDQIVANINSCNNLSFYVEELLEEGRNHNLTLHISMNCKEDSLSNILVDTGSSLDVLPKSTFARLSYQGAPMRNNGVIVKAFDGVVTSTLHQKLKFVKNGKLVIVGGDRTLLVSHLSTLTYLKAKESIGTPSQALYVANVIQKIGASMSSLKDAQEIV